MVGFGVRGDLLVGGDSCIGEIKGGADEMREELFVEEMMWDGCLIRRKVTRKEYDGLMALLRELEAT